MRLVFCGTPQFAVPTLQALLAAVHEIALVVTQPDRPVGRKQIVEPTPVKQVALAAGLARHAAGKDSQQRGVSRAAGSDCAGCDCCGGVWAHHSILDAGLATLGCINLHGSLLPKYRGAAPIQWAVAMGETVTGNTTMLLEEGLDTGPILLQQEVAIGPEQTAVDLFEILATARGSAGGGDAGGPGQWQKSNRRPQDHSHATLAPILTRDDGRMDFAAYTATEIKNRWRGFQPWPGAFTALDGKKLIVHRLEVVEPSSLRLSEAEPGQLFVDQQRLIVCCAQGTGLNSLELQLEGKKRTTAADFLRGTHLASGMRLG